MTQGQQLQPRAVPAVWQVYALLPAMIILMVMLMLFRVIGTITKPEVIKEIAPVAAEAAGRRLLPGGR